MYLQEHGSSLEKRLGSARDGEHKHVPRKLARGFQIQDICERNEEQTEEGLPGWKRRSQSNTERLPRLFSQPAGFDDPFGAVDAVGSSPEPDSQTWPFALLKPRSRAATASTFLASAAIFAGTFPPQSLNLTELHSPFGFRGPSGSKRSSGRNQRSPLLRTHFAQSLRPVTHCVLSVIVP